MAETDVVGFSLKGKGFWHKLELFDLDVVQDSKGERYLPLFRLFRALKVEHEAEEDQLVLKLPDSPPQRVKIKEQVLQTDGATRPLKLIQAVSDISMQPEVYVPAETVAQMLDLELSWDNALYAFVAETSRFFPVWKREERKSLLSIKTDEIRIKVPEKLPAAQPEYRHWGIDFVQTEARIQYQPVDERSPGKISLDSLKQRFWGDLAKGRYILEFSQPSYIWNDSGNPLSSPFIRLNRAEWTRALGASRFMVGDSTFGLNDITFPTVKLAGLRFDSLLGANEKGRNDRSKQVLRNLFQRQIPFEGLARVGSMVELFVNGRLIDTDEILSSLPDNPDLGRYEFEAVSLAPGSLNTIEIIITDPDGVQTIIEKQILGTSSLVPEGSLALLGGFGTNRGFQDWSSSGMFAGGRALYGLRSNLTIGTTFAGQYKFYDLVSKPLLYQKDERNYPLQSRHAGAQLTWQPFDRSQVLADFSAVQARERDGSGYADWAARLDLSLYPLEKTSFYARYFVYQPDFFDGGNRNLRDRIGYVVNGEFHLHPMWSFSGAFASVRDNVRRLRSETFSARLGHAGLHSKMFPKTRISLGLDWMDPDWEDSSRRLLFVEVDSNLLPRLNFSVYHSFGDDVRLTRETDFFQGLRLPGISLTETRHTTASLATYLPGLGSLRANYWKTNNRERLSGIHSLSNAFGLPLQMRTELGKDLHSGDPFFEHRCEYRFSRSKGTRLGLLARYQNREWQVGLFLTISELFSRDRGRLTRVESRRISPDLGGIAGRVFVDGNINARLDPGEGGVEGVSILLDGREMAVTDVHGQYMLPFTSIAQTVKVSLDPDTVPAIYDIMHGQQGACLEEGRRTHVDLALTPVHHIAGSVLVKKPSGKVEPVSGVRVTSVSDSDSETVIDSITAGDGSFYLGHIRPGAVRVRLDPRTIPSELTFPEQEQQTRIPVSQEPQEYELPDFVGHSESHL